MKVPFLACSDTHKHTWNRGTHRWWGLCVCDPSQHSQTSRWPSKLWFISGHQTRKLARPYVCLICGVSYALECIYLYLLLLASVEYTSPFSIASSMSSQKTDWHHTVTHAGRINTQSQVHLQSCILQHQVWWYGWHLAFGCPGSVWLMRWVPGWAAPQDCPLQHSSTESD